MKLCVVCEHLGSKIEADCKDTIYKKHRTHSILTCYSHSLEFFKLGQENFIKRYADLAKSEKWTLDTAVSSGPKWF